VNILQQMISQGGVVMIPLALCSVTALAVFLERITYLRRGHVIPRSLRDPSSSDDPSADAAPWPRKIARSPFGTILGRLVRPPTGSRPEAVERMEVAARQVASRLDRGLVVLEIIVGIAPLLGLLGTVLGLVHVFEEMSLQGDAQVLTFSRGIAEALWTTVAGLAIAIPSLVVHRFLQRKAEMLMLEMEHLAHEHLERRHPAE
jgi:biopolymer transport protein ExbB